MAKLLPYLLLLLQLLLTPVYSIEFKLGRVLADKSEHGRIVSVKYWRKFRVFMDELDSADFGTRTAMLTSPDISESLVPAELLSAVSVRLNDSEWLDQLEAEYINDGEHNMTILMDTLQELGSITEEHEETVPEEVLKQLLWRGVVRPEQQHVVRARLVAALRLFFDTPDAVSLQDEEPELFEIFILSAFEFDWMPVGEVLEDTLSDVRLNARLAADVGMAGAVDSVLAGDSEKDRIINLQYWRKFRIVIDKLDEADEDTRTAMMASPEAWEALVPYELLFEVSDHLKDNSWLDQLEAEYLSEGERNMTLVMDTIQDLVRITEQNKAKVPDEAVRQLLWRGLVRPEQQHVVRARLVAALRLFFDTPEAVSLQRQQSELFETFIVGVFEFDWMSVGEILEDTMTHHQRRDEVAADVGKTDSEEARGVREEPPEGPHEEEDVSSDSWEWEEGTFLAGRSLNIADVLEGGEQVGGAVVEERRLIDKGEGSPSWGYHVDEDEVEVAMNDSAEEGFRHGGGFLWPDSPEDEELDDDNMFKEASSDDGAGKGAREAHHEPAGEDVDGGRGKFLWKAKSEGVGEDDAHDSDVSDGEERNDGGKETSEGWPGEDLDADLANFVEDGAKRERGTLSQDVGESDLSEEASEARELYGEVEDVDDDEDADVGSSSKDGGKSKENEDANGDGNAPNEVVDSSEEVKEPRQEGSRRHHAKKPGRKAASGHREGKPEHPEHAEHRESNYGHRRKAGHRERKHERKTGADHGEDDPNEHVQDPARREDDLVEAVDAGEVTSVEPAGDGDESMSKEPGPV